MTDYKKLYDEQVAEIESRRKDLAESLASGEEFISSESIAWIAGKIAHREGQARIYKTVWKATEANPPLTGPEVKELLLAHATRSPQDDWSGYNNDVRRCRQAGIRDAINYVLLNGDF